VRKLIEFSPPVTVMGEKVVDQFLIGQVRHPSAAIFNVIGRPEFGRTWDVVGDIVITSVDPCRDDVSH